MTWIESIRKEVSIMRPVYGSGLQELPITIGSLLLTKGVQIRQRKRQGSFACSMNFRIDTENSPHSFAQKSS